MELRMEDPLIHQEKTQQIIFYAKEHTSRTGTFFRKGGILKAMVERVILRNMLSMFSVW